jgi:hypothetical protein
MADAQAALAEATGRLERALNLLEMRVRALSAQSRRSGDSDLFDQDRARLAEELDRARERGRALEEAAIEASQALGRAALDMRAVLNGEA